jgi:hypothetical protein
LRTGDPDCDCDLDALAQMIALLLQGQGDEE